MEIHATTRLFALLGDPVAHSLSPRMLNAAFRASRIDAVYVALRCSAGDAPALLRGIARAGGGGNVTLPHKETAAAAVDAPTEAVVRTGACNTFWIEDGRIRGDNTDVVGFRNARFRLIGEVHGARVLVLGAGGAARAVVWALLEDGAASIVVRNRAPARAAALQAALDPPGLRVRVEPWLGRGVDRSAFDLVVNATSLGLDAADPLPFEPECDAPPRALLDLVYAPGGTRLVRTARALGIPAADGLEMLIHQAAAAFERWFSSPAPLATLRAAALAAASETAEPAPSGAPATPGTDG